MSRISRTLSVVCCTAVIAAVTLGVPAAPASATTTTCSGGGTFTIANDVVTGHTGCKGAVIIPDGVTSIGDDAFKAAEVTSIVIPDSVTSIGLQAFFGSALASVTFKGDAPAVGTDAFGDVADGATVNIGYAADGFGVADTWNGLIVVRALEALTPDIGTPVPTACGFTVSVKNYDSAYTWDTVLGVGSLMPGVASGQTWGGAVTGLAPGQEVTLRVTTTRAGSDSGSAEVTGRALSAEAAPEAAPGDGAIAGAAGDESGSSVALSADGLTMAIGAPAANDDAGLVRIYRWNGSDWVQRGFDIVGDADDDELGRSVALSADGLSVAIGAPGVNLKTGLVRIYQWCSSEWVQRGGDIDGTAGGAWSGSSVALSDDGLTVAIGAPENETGTHAGGVRVFRYDGSNWDHRGGDIVGIANDYLGSSVALSADGDTVAIGAPDANAAKGYVRVLQYDASGSAWVARGSDIDGGAGDYFGLSVALSADGDTVAIGAPDANAAKRVCARPPVRRGRQRLGFCLAPTSTAGRATIWASRWRCPPMNSLIGHQRPRCIRRRGICARPRVRRGGSTWVQRGSDIVGGADDDLGVSVALSADGLTMAIGAPRSEPRLGTFALWPSSLTMPAPGVPSSSPSVSCVPSSVPGRRVTCTVTGGDAGSRSVACRLQRPVIAEAGVTLGADGTGTFSFMVPAAALGEVLTVRLVGWAAPVSLGMSGGPVPTSCLQVAVRCRCGRFGLLALAGVLVLRRRAFGPAGG